MRSPLSVPFGAGIQGVEWSGMTWPMAVDREGGTPAGGSAYELGLSFRPIYLREERVDLSTAVQWERRDVGQMGPPRLAARLRSRIGGLHDLRLELGALALASTDNPDRLARGDRRLALSWRMTRGQVRPWLSYELYSQNGAIERSQEAGLQLSRKLESPGHSGGSQHHTANEPRSRCRRREGQTSRRYTLGPLCRPV